MNVSIRTARFALGTAALLALAAGCSKEARPPQQPSPTFESRVEEPAAPPPVGTTDTMPEQQPGSPAIPGEGGAMQPGMAAEPPPAAPQPEPAPAATEPSKVSEEALCVELMQDGRVRVEDIQGGAALIISAAPGTDLASLRERAHKIESAMPGGRDAAPPIAGEECVLFNVARMGAKAVVVEEPNSVRMLFTIDNPEGVKALRKDVRDFVKTHKGAGQKGGVKKGPMSPKDAEPSSPKEKHLPR